MRVGQLGLYDDNYNSDDNEKHNPIPPDVLHNMGIKTPSNYQAHSVQNIYSLVRRAQCTSAG